MRSGGRTLAATVAAVCCLAACASEHSVVQTWPAEAAPTTTTTPPEPIVETEELSQPIERVIVVGDSLLFDGRDLSGGRPNEIVPTIARHLAATPGLGAVEVRNAALPGLAVKHAINPNVNQYLDTLADYLPVLLAELVRPGDLVVLAVSTIDVIVMMDDEPLPSQELLTEIVDELRRWRDLFAAVGAPVAFVAPFGVNDELYDEVKNTFVDEPKRYGLSARLRALGDALRDSDLFLLVDGFPGLDADGDGSGELSFFVDYDTRVEGWPDDGIHPNRSGETLYGDTVGRALVALLIDAV